MTEPHADDESQELGFDRLIHEPARLVLMANLYVVDEADFVFLTRRTGLTAGNISSHMSRLEAAEYVTINKTFANERPQRHTPSPKSDAPPLKDIANTSTPYSPSALQ